MSMIPPAPIAPPPGTEPAGFPDARDVVAQMVAANGGPAVQPVDTTGVYTPPPAPPPISQYQLPRQTTVSPPAPPAYAPPAPADPFAAGATPPAPAPGLPEPAPGAVGAPPQPQMVQLPDGTVIAIDRLNELAQLDRAFQSNPDVERATRDAVQRHHLFAPPGGVQPQVIPPASPQPGVQWPAQPLLPAQTPPPAPAPVVLPPPSAYPQSPLTYPQPFVAAPQLPADVDPDDPNVRWMAQQAAQLSAQQAQIAQQVAQQQALSAQANDRATSAGISAARDDLARKYPHLTFDDIATIEQQAGRLQLGVAYMNMYGDHRRAAFEAMDSAALTIPTLRPKLQTAPPGVQAAIDQQRQQALYAVAGGGGAAPRTAEPQPRQMTTQEKVAGMANELSAHLAGGPT
jgi:hypothetical protein